MNSSGEMMHAGTIDTLLRVKCVPGIDSLERSEPCRVNQ